MDIVRLIIYVLFNISKIDYYFNDDLYQCSNEEVKKHNKYIDIEYKNKIAIQKIRKLVNERFVSTSYKGCK